MWNWGRLSWHGALLSFWNLPLFHSLGGSISGCIGRFRRFVGILDFIGPGAENVGAEHIGVRVRGLEGGTVAPWLGQSHYFRAKAKFFGQKPAAKNEQKYISAFIKRKQESLANAKVSVRCKDATHYIGPHLGSPSNINVIYTSLKSNFSAQQFPRWQCGSIFIRLAVAASQTCQATYWLKIAHSAPRSLCSLWNFAVKLSVRKLEACGYYVVKVAWS